MLSTLIEQLQSGRDLSPGQVTGAIEQLAAESVGAEEKAAFLTALAVKGETPEEIAAFAMELRGRSIEPPLDEATRNREILDVCGTGGDRVGTFNISTTVAIIAASAGVTVAKHGNRALTSRSGSADVLDALGVRIDLAPDEAARSLRERQFAFFFAPRYHPAFKHIAPARKLCAERGQRTLFNFLGPLLNPARPSAQLVGVSRPDLCEPIARVLQSLGVRRAMVVSGRAEGAQIDELSTLGDTLLAEFYHDRGFATSVLAPSGFPVQPARLANLSGGDPAANAEIVRRLLRGEDTGPRLDAVLLNSAAALFVAGVGKSMADGWHTALDLINRGKAWSKLEELTANE